MTQVSSDKGDPTWLILVRHGQTAWNKEKRIQGQLEVDLCEEGRRQADLAAQRLSGVGATVLYSSDLKRALASAEPIARTVGLTIQLAPQLRERHFGQWQGLTWEEIYQRHPELRHVQRGDPHREAPGRESREQVQARVVAFAEKVAHDHPGQIVIAVSHGGPIAQLLRWILGMPLATPAHLSSYNGSLTVVRWKDNRWSLVCFNDHCHVAQKALREATGNTDFAEENRR